jgi:threonylcarbamoyladenosine tRNA methylthiotransferase MtaB
MRMSKSGMSARDVVNTYSERELTRIISCYGEEKFAKSIARLIVSRREKEPFEKCRVSSFSERTRAYIKIEDGCSRFCSYCIIPYARGRVRSKSIADITEEAELIGNSGYKEVVLTGINLSLYGTDSDSNLCEAVEAVAKAEGIERIRLGSLEPEYLDENVLERLSKVKKFCPQFHLSLQSGCDKTLKDMNRNYTSAEYAQIVSNIRRFWENPAITTDVMVGFAGESDEDFISSLEFVKSIGFAKVHVFPYSKREGTKAWDMKGHLTNAVKTQRAAVMGETVEKSTIDFMNSQLGKVSSVLFETLSDKGYFGLTENFTPVVVESDVDIRSQILDVEIISTEGELCIAKLL